MLMEGAIERRFQRIEAILAEVAEGDAAAAVRMDRAEARMDRMESRFEKRMLGFEKLVKIGFRELTELRRLHRDTDKKLNSFIAETDHKVNALIDAQQRTEVSLRAFLNGLRRGGNGRSGGRS